MTYDSENGNVFTLHTPHEDIELQECTERLFYHDTDNSYATIFVTIVRQKKTMYANHPITKTKQTQKLQSTIGYLRYRIIIGIVKNKSIKDCPITHFNVKAAEDIFGPNFDALQGKTTTTKPNHATLKFPTQSCNNTKT